MTKTPLDEIILQIADASNFTSDEIYVFFLLNVYGPMDIDGILKQSKTRSWSKSLPAIVKSLSNKQLVMNKQDNFVAASLDQFHELIKNDIDISLTNLKALKDFI